jgi:NADPH:quinone reductase-like Zn-dependent oxidoreductase
MALTENTAAWLPGVGKQLEVRPAEIPVPGEGELLVEVSKAMKTSHMDIPSQVYLFQGLKTQRQLCSLRLTMLTL